MSQENPAGDIAPTAPTVSPFDTFLAGEPTTGQADSQLDAAPATLTFASPGAPAGDEPPGRNLALERHVQKPARGTGALDWVAFVLAFLVAPLGILVAIAALVVSSRRNGWTSGIAKAAIAIGVVLTVVLAGGYALLSNVQQKQASRDAVVASSQPFCHALSATPGVLQSPTYGWPAVQDTIADSITAMQQYEDTWTGLARIAPAGIRSGAAGIAKAARLVIANVTSSRVLDDSANVSQVQQAVSASGVSTWVSSYCG